MSAVILERAVSLMNLTKSVKIVKYEHGTFADQEDILIVEYPLTLFIGEREFVTLLCTPEHLENMVVGYLKSENIINDYEDLDTVIVDENKGEAHIKLKDQSILDDVLFRRRFITSGCASNATFYDALDAVKLSANMSLDFKWEIPLAMNQIVDMVQTMNQSSELFEATGGVHICCLFDQEKLLFMREDIGRHNAVDKVVGELLKSGMTWENKIIFLSGRISSEMVLKCAKIGISVIVSRSAPMDMAVRLAEKLDITLIGFARGNRANIYSGFKRVER